MGVGRAVRHVTAGRARRGEFVRKAKNNPQIAQESDILLLTLPCLWPLVSLGLAAFRTAQEVASAKGCLPRTQTQTQHKIHNKQIFRL